MFGNVIAFVALILSLVHGTVEAFSFPSSSSASLQPVQTGDAVVVTGCSSGIGYHAALSLVKEGFIVFACFRKEEDGHAFLQAADEDYDLDVSLIHTLKMDVTNSKDIARGVETVSSVVGERGLKGLFNNAGTGGGNTQQQQQQEEMTSATGHSTAVEHLDIGLVRDVMEVNYFSMVSVTQAFLKLLRQGKGRIINNSSVAGYIASPYVSHYAASKFAVEGFSDSLRRELLPLDVTVSVLECGFITTPILTGYIPPSVEPYKDAEQIFYKGWWRESLGAPTPKASSRAVIHAMRAKRPRVRYVVGKGAALLAILRYIPTSWLDRVVGVQKAEFDEQDRQELAKKINAKYDL